MNTLNDIEILPQIFASIHNIEIDEITHYSIGRFQIACKVTARFVTTIGGVYGVQRKYTLLFPGIGLKWNKQKAKARIVNAIKVRRSVV